MVNMNRTGQRIASLRREAGLTQEQLASALHITGQAVSKWENGNALPDTALLPMIARALHTTIDRLLTGEDSVIPIGPYDEEYARQEPYWGTTPSALAERAVSLIVNEWSPGKRLLDIGSGEGRDALYFAKCGFIVDALEISWPGIEKIQQHHALTGLPIHAVHANMIGFEMMEQYDIIYSMGSLQFLPLEQRNRHFELYKQHTNRGGLNVHCVFVEKPFIKTAPDWQKNEFFYRSGDLAGYYHDWEIIYCEEAILDCNSAHIPHQHAISSIIAKKI